MRTEKWRENERGILTDTIFFRFRVEDVSSDPHRPTMQISGLNQQLRNYVILLSGYENTIVLHRYR